MIVAEPDRIVVLVNGGRAPAGGLVRASLRWRRGGDVPARVRWMNRALDSCPRQARHSITFISGQAITAPQEFKMESSSEAKEPRDPLNIITVILAAVIVVSVSLVGYVIYDNCLRRVRDRSKEGDTVTLNYIGSFDNGWVFDTSLLNSPRITPPTRSHSRTLPVTTRAT